MAALLHPDHGTVIMNVHGGGMSTGNALVGLFTRLLSGDENRGYHPSTEQGRAVQEVTSVLRSGTGCVPALLHVLKSVYMPCHS